LNGALCIGIKKYITYTHILFFYRKDRPDIASMTDHELTRYMALNGHCSALIKVTGDLSAMYSGHTAWWTYSFMLRIMKHYDLPLTDPYTASTQVSFSSYPAALTSIDDFYITNRYVY
jgi:hypothetical protein